METMIYKELEWYIINETAKEKLLFLKEGLPDELIERYFDKYDTNHRVQFNEDPTKIWWKDSYIRKILNGPFLDYLNINELNVMRTTLELDEITQTTKDYVRLITKKEVRKLPKEVLKRIKGYYWTMNPYNFSPDSNCARVFCVGGSSSIGPFYGNVYDSLIVRSVISLRKEEKSIITDYDEEYKQMLIKRFNNANKLLN